MNKEQNSPLADEYISLCDKEDEMIKKKTCGIPFSTIFFAIITFLIMVVIVKKDDVNDWLENVRVRNYMQEEYSFESVGVTTVCNIDDVKGFNIYVNENEKIGTSDLIIDTELFENVLFDSVLTEDTLMEMGSTKCIVYEGITNNETFHKLLQNINEINALHTEKDIHILFGVSIPDNHTLRYIKAENEDFMIEIYVYY